MLCVCFALCHLPVGRVGRVRRVGHLIFKKEMLESFALGRCLGFPVENCFRKAPDVSQSRTLHSLVENCFRKALQVNFKKPLSYASYASYTSYFAICKREAQCLALRPASREARRFGMRLCAPCRGAPTVVLRFSCQRSSVACRTCISACHFQSAKHTFKASGACILRTLKV